MLLMELPHPCLSQGLPSWLPTGVCAGTPLTWKPILDSLWPTFPAGAVGCHRSRALGVGLAQDPQQLLQIYARLEEENLFLIQATQEAEEGLEQAQEQLRRTQAAMDAQADTLDRQVQDLQQGLGSEQQRCRTLRVGRPATRPGLG